MTLGGKMLRYFLYRFFTIDISLLQLDFVALLWVLTDDEYKVFSLFLLLYYKVHTYSLAEKSIYIKHIILFEGYPF